jgi:hypothetical protein
MAITTPFFHAVNSLTPTDSTSISALRAWGPLDMDSIAGNAAQHAIVLVYDQGAGQTEKKLLYATAALRNTDLASLLAELSTTI